MSQSPVVALEGSLTIERASEMQAFLLEHLRPESHLSLAQISDIDCSGLQLLLASKRQFPALQLTQPSPAVAELFGRLGLSALLAD